MLREHDINVHHSTIYRWIQEYTPILYQVRKRKNKKHLISGVSMKHISKLKVLSVFMTYIKRTAGLFRSKAFRCAMKLISC